jgi:hypothetical protein
MMADWEKSAKTKPPPLVKVAGLWIFNPERQLKELTPSHKRKNRKAAEK